MGEGSEEKSTEGQQREGQKPYTWGVSPMLYEKPKAMTRARTTSGRNIALAHKRKQRGLADFRKACYSGQLVEEASIIRRPRNYKEYQGTDGMWGVDGPMVGPDGMQKQ
jgi:hypothetical protein